LSLREPPPCAASVYVVSSMWPFPKKDAIDDEFVVVGGRRSPARDLYGFLMRAPWSTGIFVVLTAFLLVNVVFGAGYALTGGVAGTRPHSFADAFFFSVQTLGTLGYGAMYPQTTTAHVLVTIEVLGGVLMLALVTGFTYSKFSNVRARLQFGEHAVLSKFNGVLTLMVRVGNERRSRVIDARIRVSLTRLERTQEGVTFYRMIDLALERSRIPNLARSWTIFHPVTKDSPLYGATPESLAAAEVEFVVLVIGLDETSSQTLHAQRLYDHKQIVWGARHADLLSELPDGRLKVDLTQFNRILPTAPTDDFPYPRPKAKA
jgi:inward rectifier potassium channel